MIQMEPIKGAIKSKASSYYNPSQRPVMVCDTQGCKGRFEGNASQDEGSLKDRVHSMGWTRDPSTSKDMCPACCGSSKSDTDKDGK